jgi:branched-chain amino acid transport system ATP-binding protein
VVRDIFKIIEEIRKEGTTVLIVEQNAKQTMKIADYAYVLEVGEISMEGPADELIHNPKLIEAYLGG